MYTCAWRTMFNMHRKKMP